MPDRGRRMKKRGRCMKESGRSIKKRAHLRLDIAHPMKTPACSMSDLAYPARKIGSPALDNFLLDF